MPNGQNLLTCMFRLLPKKFGRSGTDRGGGHVVHDVGKTRAVGAVVIAAGVVLSGCGLLGGGASTTTSSSAEPPSNPWDLPVERRPALFDPCAEMPVDAVEQGLGGAVEKIDYYTIHNPGELMVCGWKSDQVDVSVLSTWKSRDEYLVGRTLTVTDNEIGGRSGMRGLDKADSTDRSCVQVFFTERGTVLVNATLIALYREFKSERFADSCDVLEQVIPPIMEHFPKGDF